MSLSSYLVSMTRLHQPDLIPWCVTWYSPGDVERLTIIKCSYDICILPVMKQVVPGLGLELGRQTGWIRLSKATGLSSFIRAMSLSKGLLL